jgi:nucleoside-triphosphatase THEP1
LQQLVEEDASRDGKIIFSGHRGCGKSTLLAEFGRQCTDRGYFVVFFSIADTIEMSDVDHINILFAIALNLMLEAEKASVSIPKSAKAAIDNWFAKKARIITETPVSAEVSVGFDLFKMISGKLKSEASVREEIRKEFEKKISQLVEQINIIAAEIQAATQQDVLVIIDDLDKLDLAIVEEIYKKHIKALFLPGFRIIFTIPISALRETSLRSYITTESDNQIIEMPVTKTFVKGERRKDSPDPVAEAMQTLCEVLHRRIDRELLEPEIAAQIVFYSGGVLRELIRLTNVCCRICLRSLRRHPNRQDMVIDHAVLEEAVKELRLDFEMQLGKADYEILQTTYEKFLPDDPKAQKFLDLLHGLHVLEYRNGEIWYDAHPIVIDLLKRKGLV